MMTPAQEILIYYRKAVGDGQIFDRKQDLLLERPLEKHENITDVTRLVQEAADWVGYRVEGVIPRARMGAPSVDYILKPVPGGDEGRAWLEISRPEMERAAELALEIGELENSLEDDGLDKATIDRLNMLREDLGTLMTDFILIWRA